MPTHAPYRSPVSEFGLWIIWTFARYLTWAYRLACVVGRPLRSLGRWLARRAVRLGRHCVEVLADLQRTKEPGEYSLQQAILISLLVGLAVWIVVMAVAG